MKYLLIIALSFNIFAYEEISSHSKFYAKIQEYQKKSKVKNEDILVVYDIDNTLMKFKTIFGTDEWYYWQKDQIKKGCPEHCIAKSAGGVLKYFFLATHMAKMKPVEENIPTLVNKIQESGYRVMALTSRGPVNRPATMRELGRNGLNFNKSNAIAKPFKAKLNGRDTSYENGVFMTSGLNKGEMLTYVTNLESKKFKAIFFLDDRLKHMKTMDKAFKGKLDIFAYRLTTMDPMLEEFRKSDKKETIKMGETFMKLREQLTY